MEGRQQQRRQACMVVVAGGGKTESFLPGKKQQQQHSQGGRCWMRPFRCIAGASLLVAAGSFWAGLHVLQVTAAVRWNSTTSSTISAEQAQPVLLRKNNETVSVVKKLLPSMMPRFVWHVGPMKTGTTSIQGELAALRDTLLQEKDGWFFAGQTGVFQGIKKPDFVHRFTIEMKRLRQQGLNVVLSNENFSVFYRAQDYEQIAQALGEEWDVTVVVGYRPYYEWIPSMWSQIHKLTRKEENGQHNYTWHEQRVSPMFPNYYDKIDKSSLFADSVVQAVQPYFDKIEMLNLYDDGDDDGMSIQSRFVCKVLRAQEACTECRRRVEKRINQGSLEPIHANAIAFAAAQAGMIDTQRWNRPAVIQMIVAHLHDRQQPTTNNNKNETTTTYRWPMVCPSPQAMDRLWRQTIDKEAHIFPSLAKRNPNREARLRDGFDHKIEKQTYCTVDTARVLVEQQEFFKALA